MQLTSRSRPLTPQDLTSFDYVIGMDASNLAAIHVRPNRLIQKRTDACSTTSSACMPPTTSSSRSESIQARKISGGL